MAEKKDERRVALYVPIDEELHFAIQVVSMYKGRTIADIVRELLRDYVSANSPSQEEMETMVNRVRSAVGKHGASKEGKR